MKQLTVKKTIEINAPASKVWDVLTNRELTKQYMFDCELISDCKLGNPIIWKGASDDKVYVKGTITGIAPGKHLQFTVFDPNAADHYEDVQSSGDNYLNGNSCPRWYSRHEFGTRQKIYGRHVDEKIVYFFSELHI